MLHGVAELDASRRDVANPAPHPKEIVITGRLTIPDRNLPDDEPKP